MRMLRFAGCVLSSGPVGLSRTCGRANSGAQRATGSLSDSLPSSTWLITAATVTGLVMDAIRNSVSRPIGRPASTSR